MVNYHNHTPLCGHARGELREYVEKAIASGITEIGFSDHASMPEELRDGISMAPDQMEYYVGEVIKVRDEYAGRIEVRLGFEVDFPLFDTFDVKYITDPRVDFIMGSCHFIDDWAFDHPDQVIGFDRRDVDDIYSDYYSILERLVDSRLFDIVGHFDLVKKFGHRAGRSMEGIIRTISAKMARSGTAAEINTAGLRKPVGEIYPSDDIIEIFFRENVPVTLGSDSHSPDEVGYGYALALEKLKKAGYRKLSGFRRRKRYEVEIS